MKGYSQFHSLNHYMGSWCSPTWDLLQDAFQLHFRLQHFCLHLCKICDGISWHTYCTKIMVWYLLCCDKLICATMNTIWFTLLMSNCDISAISVSQLTLHIFHIVMSETIKFITHMCHEPWSAIIGKTIFCCSAECHETHPFFCKQPFNPKCLRLFYPIGSHMMITCCNLVSIASMKPKHIISIAL